MTYTIETDDYETMMVLALLRELLRGEEEETHKGDLFYPFITRHSPQIILWVLFQFDVLIELLRDSDDFKSEDELWPKIMKQAEGIADAIRYELEEKVESK